MERKQGGSINEGKEIGKNCSSCASACCGPLVNLELSNKERDFLRTAGTYLLLRDDLPSDNPDKNFYSLESKCGFVVIEDHRHKCSVHDDQRRPAICSNLRPGGKSCKQIKESRKNGTGYKFGY
jgi:hypothetical protein